MACELDPGRALRLHASVADGRLTEALHADFLRQPIQPYFARVVMNPPFTRGQDIAHVEHALQFLKPGGRLVAIMSGGILFRTGRQAAFHQRIMDLGGTIAALPADSFKASGTSVATCLVMADVPASSEGAAA